MFRGSIVNILSNFYRNESGNYAVIFSLVLLTIGSASGMAVDYARGVSAKSDLQNAVDAAVLAASRESNQAKRQSVFEDVLDTATINAPSYDLVEGSAKVTLSGGVLTGTAQANVDTIFASLMHVDHINVNVEAAVSISQMTSEIALVLDVSSSMIEDGRFAPMIEAAKKFVTTIADGTSGLANTTISIVPFSSRINPGMANTSFLKKWKGNPKVPDRWNNPYTYYPSSTYWKINWVNGVDFAMYNGKNYYWMGCVEPRIDFAVHEGTSTVTALASDNPNSGKFLAQDYNTQSGLSFCPPPVVPLTNNENTLINALDIMTSEGSTRLDAGIIGGWYALSPKWKNSWVGGIGPNNSSKDNRKIVVFMTDGKMNTNDDSSTKHFDWVCEAGGNCDDYATDSFLGVCTNMKKDGIDIYTVSYDPDADRTNLKACASGSDYFYEATSTSGSDYITDVYEKIATVIAKSSYALVK